MKQASDSSDFHLDSAEMAKLAGTQAELFFEALKSYLQDEESTLLEGETLAIIHGTAGSPVHIDSIILYNPLAIAFVGRDMVDGTRSSVFAHVTSAQIQFRVVKHVAEEPRTPIGFVIAGQE
jgi:hypothetical protein